MPRRRRQRKRSTQSLRRAMPSRATYDRVLIVCEGSKTEPNYLKQLKSDLRINNANLRIVGDQGSAPETVVQTAIDEFAIDPDIDTVFCMFDKDEHSTYGAAIARVNTKRLKRKGAGYARFNAITSVPCFEYWLILHFVNTDAPYQCTGTVTAAENVVRQLRAYIPNYTKGGDNAYRATRDHIDTAITRSMRVMAQVEVRGGDNPSTRVHEQVTFLKSLTQP